MRNEMKHAVSSTAVLNALALCANSNAVITLHDFVEKALAHEQ